MGSIITIIKECNFVCKTYKISSIYKFIIAYYFLSIYSLTYLFSDEITHRADTCLHTNPIIKFNQCPDPTIWKGDNDFYYASHTESINNLHAYRSKDLINWETQTIPLITETTKTQLRKLGEKKGMRKNKDATMIWAPQVFKHDHYYILYASLENKCGIFALVSSTPYGPFHFQNDNANLLLTTKQANMPYDVIDPFVVKDTNGELYMFFGSAFGIYRVQLEKDGLSIKKGANFVHVAGMYVDPKETPIDTSREKTMEGCSIYQKGNYWYLFASKGSTNNNSYRVIVGRSSSLTGIFKDKEGNPLNQGYGTTILESTPYLIGTGGNSEIFQDKKNDHYIFYHARVLPKNGKGVSKYRYLCLSELKWDKKGWPYVEYHRPREIINKLPYVNNTTLTTDLLQEHPYIIKEETESELSVYIETTANTKVQVKGENLSIIENNKQTKEITFQGNKKITFTKGAGIIIIDDWKSIIKISNYDKYNGLIFHLNCIKKSPIKNISILNGKVYGDISTLYNKQNLTHLLLYKNPDVYGNIKYLKENINLLEINLSATSCYGNIKELTNIRNLKYLDISNTIGFIQGDFSIISTFKNLEYFNCINTKNTISWKRINLKKDGVITAITGCFDNRQSVLNYLGNMARLTPSSRYKIINIYCKEEVEIPNSIKLIMQKLGYTIYIKKYQESWKMP